VVSSACPLYLTDPNPAHCWTARKFPRSGMALAGALANLTARIHRLMQPVIAAGQRSRLTAESLRIALGLRYPGRLRSRRAFSARHSSTPPSRAATSGSASTSCRAASAPAPAFDLILTARVGRRRRWLHWASVSRCQARCSTTRSRLPKSVRVRQLRTRVDQTCAVGEPRGVPSLRRRLHVRTRSHPGVYSGEMLEAANAAFHNHHPPPDRVSDNDLPG